MNVRFTEADVLALAPQLCIAVLAMAVLLIDAFWPRGSKRGLANFCLLGLAFTAAVQLFNWPDGEPRAAVYGMVAPDLYTAAFNLVFLIGTALSILLSVEYLDRENIAHGEYYALLLFTTLGMMVMAASVNLIAIFLGLEILSISLYVLAGYQRERLASEEAALKYFLLGAFASAFFLYGIALTYGAAGTLRLDEIHARLSLAGNEPARNYLLVAGVALMLVGFGFKVAVVPFHLWTPDVYEGAPTSVTAFMSVGSKAAGFAAFVRVLTLAFPTPQLQADISLVVAWIAALTMIVGNVVAVVQTNIKRLLAYSSIAQAGYILLGVVAAIRDPMGTGVGSVLFYTLAYTFTNLGAFAVVLALRRRGEELLNLEDLSGLGNRYPWLGGLMALFMLSLAGLPPTAGFFGKLYLFQSLLSLPDDLQMRWLVVIAVLTSVVSFFYYLRVVTNMYMEQPKLGPEDTEYAGRGYLGVGLAASALGTVLLGLLPAAALRLANQVGDAIRAAQQMGLG